MASALLWNFMKDRQTDQPTSQPTNHPTDMRAYREVTVSFFQQCFDFSIIFLFSFFSRWLVFPSDLRICKLFFASRLCGPDIKMCNPYLKPKLVDDFPFFPSKDQMYRIHPFIPMHQWFVERSWNGGSQKDLPCGTSFRDNSPRRARKRST